MTPSAIGAICELLKASLFDKEVNLQDVPKTEWQAIFSEMKFQGISSLPLYWLKSHRETIGELVPTWEKYILMERVHWLQLVAAQDALTLLLDCANIPYVVLKGNASAIAYPHPDLRSAGDIDILVKRTDIDRTDQLLRKNGYVYKESAPHHNDYQKNGVHIEVHRRLPAISEHDEQLIRFFEDGIEHRRLVEVAGHPFYMLPPVLHGLVILFHNETHLRLGIGLRQIIDWMMFVRCHLNDSVWKTDFQPILFRFGLEKFAIVSTGLCHKYLGLEDDFKWYADADSDLCGEFFEYIMEHGNLGKKIAPKNKTSTFLTSVGNPTELFIRLQDYGIRNWKTLRKFSALKVFAWTYGAYASAKMLLKQKVSPKDFIQDVHTANRKKDLLRRMGLSTERTLKFE